MECRKGFGRCSNEKSKSPWLIWLDADWSWCWNLSLCLGGMSPNMVSRMFLFLILTSWKQRKGWDITFLHVEKSISNNNLHGWVIISLQLHLLSWEINKYHHGRSPNIFRFFLISRSPRYPFFLAPRTQSCRVLGCPVGTGCTVNALYISSLYK